MPSMTQYVARHSPKQAEIVNGLLDNIHSGMLNPGARVPSLTNLSKRYGASANTVQRAIVYLRENGYLETSVHGSRVVLNPPHLSHFGILLPYTTFKSQFCLAIEKEAEHISQTTSAGGIERRFSSFHDVWHPEETIRRHTRLMEALAERTIGGLIIVGGSVFLKNVIEKHRDVPCVSFFTSRKPGVPNIRLQGIEDYALDIIKQSGRRRVAFITDGRVDKRMIDKFTKAAQQRGLVTHTWWIHGITFDGVVWADTCMQMVMRGAEKPDAVISDDNLVTDATAGIAASGVKTPDDLLVVAHANFPHVTESSVPAIRLGTNVRRLMKTAVELIEAKRRSEEVPEEIMLPLYIQEEPGGNVEVFAPSSTNKSERG